MVLKVSLYNQVGVVSVVDPAGLHEKEEALVLLVLHLQLCNRLSEIQIELIDIEGSRREILEAFRKSPYLNVTYSIDLKIGT